MIEQCDFSTGWYNTIWLKKSSTGQLKEFSTGWLKIKIFCTFVATN